MDRECHLIVQFATKSFDALFGIGGQIAEASEAAIAGLGKCARRLSTDLPIVDIDTGDSWVVLVGIGNDGG